MRPSRVETSEPAWVNRKMLSMKSSTSWFCTSRKYSAMVSADSATRRRVPGGSSIWPKTSAVCVDDAGLGHLRDEVVALTGALADAGEHRGTTEVLGDPGDHLLDEHRLADAGTAEQADLAALHVRGEQVDDLDAGLQHLGLGLELVEGRGLAVDPPALGDLELLAASVTSRHVAECVEHVALGDVADRHRDRAAGVAHRGAADQAVGRLHARWRGPCCRRGAGRPRGSACLASRRRASTSTCRAL